MRAQACLILSHHIHVHVLNTCVIYLIELNTCIIIHQICLHFVLIDGDESEGGGVAADVEAPCANPIDFFPNLNFSPGSTKV
jgi:hypothetical protein